MRLEKGLFFIVTFFLLFSLVYSQGSTGPIAKWDIQAGISINKEVLTEGSSVTFSAKMVLLRSAGGLRVQAGIGRRVLLNQSLVGTSTVQDPVTQAVHFTCKVTRGRHRVFFKLIPPANSQVTPPAQITKLIHVVPRVQNTQPPPNVQTQPNTSLDLCELHKNKRVSITLKQITPQYLAGNDTISVSFTVKNNSQRCIRKFNGYINITRSDMTHGSIRVLTFELLPDKFGDKWVLKGMEQKSFLQSFLPRPEFRWPQILRKCSANPQRRCIKGFLILKVLSDRGNELASERIEFEVDVTARKVGRG